MKKFYLSLFMLFLNVIMLTPTQASNEKYADDLDWYQFNLNRARNPSLSDQDRWAASQLAVQNIANLESKYGSFGNTPTAHDIYRCVGDTYHSNLLPPLSSNSFNITSSYSYTSSPNSSYSTQRQQNSNLQYKTTEESSEQNIAEKCMKCNHLYCGREWKTMWAGNEPSTFSVCKGKSCHKCAGVFFH